MPAIASARSRSVELAWLAFAVANLAGMALWERWETIPFHFIWVSLTLVYGFRVWRPAATAATLCFVAAATGSLILVDIASGTQEWGELFEVPLMSAMFLAMVWHARRRQDALAVAEQHSAQLESLLARQERFLQDASHELRTPVTIARGHLEVRRRAGGDGAAGEVDVALDELCRIERIIERLLLLARADQPDFVERREIDLDHFLEDVFIRWSEVAPRRWRLGDLAGGTLDGDAEQLRIALDALLENAVKYSEPGDEIELSSSRTRSGVTIAVRDEGIGVPEEELGRIFERFARVDPARTRAEGGVGLGLAIVDTIAKAHGGRAHVQRADRGSIFLLDVPNFRPSRALAATDAPTMTAATQAAPQS
jgi:signal transduction histidine kinase